MRVLLTGGYGCIGSWIVRNLLDRGDQVWVYDLKEDPRRLRLLVDEGRLAEVTFVQGDVTDLTHLRQAIDRNEITHVIHLAGLQVPTCRADPILGAKVNVIGTLAVFEAAVALKGQVERVVYASSDAVHGPPAPYNAGPIGDEVRLAPVTHYGAFKVCNE